MIKCSWEVIRYISLKPRPPCKPAKWKVKVAADYPMFGGETLYLCDYHKNNLALRYEKVEKLPEDPEVEKSFKPEKGGKADAEK